VREGLRLISELDTCRARRERAPSSACLPPEEHGNSSHAGARPLSQDTLPEADREVQSTTSIAAKPTLVGCAEGKLATSGVPCSPRRTRPFEVPASSASPASGSPEAGRTDLSRMLPVDAALGPPSKSDSLARTASGNPLEGDPFEYAGRAHPRKARLRVAVARSMRRASVRRILGSGSVIQHRRGPLPRARLTWAPSEMARETAALP